MATFADEGGLRNHRTEFVRENVDAQGNPVTPTDPAFQLFSDRIRSFEWEPTPGVEEERGLGDADPDDHEKAPEEHQITITYDLQNWFVDGTGNPLDASADGILRTVDNRLPNTHTVVDREFQSQVASGATFADDGTQRDQRKYTVGRGATIDEVVITGDPSEQQPVTVEITYECETVRPYKIDQPASASSIAVISSSANDTMSLTVEDEGGATTETITLTGNTLAGGSTSFDNIDALELDAVPEGTVEIFVNDGDSTAPTQGAKLSEIKGSSDYSADATVGGDTGVPTVGTGQHGAAIGTAYETILGDALTRGGSPLAVDINSRAITVSNNTERTPKDDSVGQRVHVGNRNTEVEATTIGPSESHGRLTEALTNEGSDIVWTMAGGTFTVVNARLTEPGTRTNETGQTSMQLENTFNGEGLSLA